MNQLTHTGRFDSASVNSVLPYVAYVQTKARIGPVDALLVASLLPVLWGLVEFLRQRRVKALSILVLDGIAPPLIDFHSGGPVQASPGAPVAAIAR